jgi:NADH-quinone oxidoreductase subunit L
MADSINLLDALSWIVLILPLGGFVVLCLFGDAINRDREQKGATLLACALVVMAFMAALTIAWRLPEGARAEQASFDAQRADYAKRGIHVPKFAGPPVRHEPALAAHLIDVSGLQVQLKLLIDPLSSLLMLVITGIGSLIHIYSLGYMSHDPERVRYFSYLNLFTFFMLLLVMGGSLPLMFVGWEGVGLCSYLLIGFWFKKQSASDAGKKAFIVNRIGDAGLLLGMALALHAFGTIDLAPIVDNAAARLPAEGLGQMGVITAVCLLLFVGACGKSAQIPLHVWLPDAMEGPTPVSALIHAATMVTAGVYMLARLGPLYAMSATAMMVVAVVGTATALMAATVALVQTDIKKVLAYSTVSQLGYMVLACGVGAFGVGVFHLFTHAFFKALLFLGAGSVIHALSGEQDLRRMGGLRKKIPWTFWTFLVGTLAIAGVPPLAGFFSKDEILGAALHAHRPVLFAVGMLTALLTAFYMTRLLVLTFFGTYRGSLEKDHGHDGHGHDDGHGHAGGIHESPPSMLMPLVVLAVGSILVGFIPIPHIVGAPAEKHPAWLPFVATLTALAGMALAWYLYIVYTSVPGALAARFGALRRAFEAKWGFDDAAHWFARRAVVDGSREVLFRRVDVGVIDGLVNGTATLAGEAAQGSRSVQSGLVRGYVVLILGGSVALLAYLLWLPR